MNCYGWIPPTDEMIEKDARYPFSLLPWAEAAEVNTELEVPDLWNFYDQGATPRCVAFSSQFLSSIYAYNYHISQGYTRSEALGLITKYDAPWLWKACKGTVNGAYIEDALDVLRKGNVIAGTDKQILREGIQNYVHIRSANELRIAADHGAIGLLGIPWHRNWKVNPKDGIAVLDDNPKTWGPIDGYHSINWDGWWDTYGGTRVNNTWGSDWNEGARIILTGKAIDYMLRYERAMGTVVTDIPVTPEPPPPAEIAITINGTSNSGSKWTGILKKVKA